MKNTFFRNSIGVFLLTLMFFKVSSFHVYAHEDNASDTVENCSICEVAIENQNSDFLHAAAQSIPRPLPLIISNESQITVDSFVSSSLLRFRFFGRPPPSL
ncbi:hypothetical protein [Maribacter sp. 2210JD10-5]|uniref:hypothetical protein n=1 Tax=Maribacter sp. 2210JD10-5 TaxID=3386272 RepID=UPI0039BC74E3